MATAKFVVYLSSDVLEETVEVLEQFGFDAISKALEKDCIVGNSFEIYIEEAEDE